MLSYLAAIAGILLLLGGWVAVQALARRLAADDPQAPAAQGGEDAPEGGCGLCSLAALCQQQEANDRRR